MPADGRVRCPCRALWSLFAQADHHLHGMIATLLDFHRPSLHNWIAICFILSMARLVVRTAGFWTSRIWSWSWTPWIHRIDIPSGEWWNQCCGLVSWDCNIILYIIIYYIWFKLALWTLKHKEQRNTVTANPNVLLHDALDYKVIHESIMQCIRFVRSFPYMFFIWRRICNEQLYIWKELHAERGSTHLERLNQCMTFPYIQPEEILCLWGGHAAGPWLILKEVGLFVWQFQACISTRNGWAHSRSGGWQSWVVWACPPPSRHLEALSVTSKLFLLLDVIRHGRLSIYKLNMS